MGGRAAGRAAAGRPAGRPPARRGAERSRRRSLAARLHADRPADDAADAEVRERVPGHASLHAFARPGRLRRPAGRCLRPRRRRADRARVPLRHLERHADRRAPHQRQQTIQFFAQHQVARQGEQLPVTIDVLGAVDGTNNFSDSYSPARRRRDLAVARTPRRPLRRSRSGSTTPTRCRASSIDDNNTFMFGLGARIRVRPSVYLLFEAAPRVGYEPDKPRTSASRSSAAPAATRSSSTSRTASARRCRRSRAAASTTTTGIWASTSRENSSRAGHIW